LTEVISVRFKNNGKVYYFDPNGNTAEKGQKVMVETSKGLEFAECVQGNHGVDDSSLIPPLRPVIRVATREDEERAEANARREKEAFEICREKIAAHGLDMKLVDVEYNFEGSKILFFFTSDGRIDFRELVKDLASVFKTRIELRQIGVRDEARMLGGLGICGKPFCCAQFLDDFQPVSIKMAKTQGLSLNPTKISGACGRLMCCLKYEQEAYEDLVKNAPKADAFVETPAGKATVTDVNLLRGKVRVRLEDQADNAIRTFDVSEIDVLGGKAKRAEYLEARAAGKIQPEPRRRTERLVVPKSPAEPPADAPAPEAPAAAGPADSGDAAQPAAEKPRRRSSHHRGRGRSGAKQNAQTEPAAEATTETPAAPDGHAEHRPHFHKPQRARDENAGTKPQERDGQERAESKPHRRPRRRRPGGRKGDGETKPQT